MSVIYDEEMCVGMKTREDGSSNLKNVLMLGDSIRMGCCEYTKKYLENFADVRFPDENCRYTQYTYTSLQNWKNLFANPEAVDAVYWNNGHWDIAHWDGAEESLNSIGCYSEMLVKIYHKLKKYFPFAEIIFSTTFPMNPNGIVGINPRNNKEIKEYNEAAKSVLIPLGAKIDDVFTQFSNMPEELYADYCHLVPKGFEILGKHAADFIKSCI